MAICSAQAPQPQEAPKKPKKEKPARRGTYVLILPVLDHTGAQDDESSIRSLYARAGMLNAFHKRKWEIVPRIVTQGVQDQTQIDVSKTDNWTPENLEKLAEGIECQYVAAAELLDLQPSDRRAEANIAAWLYDVKQHKFVMQGEKVHAVYVAKKRDEKLDQKTINYEVIVEAGELAFKEPAKPVH